jgi:hypothetical protein
MLIKVMQGLESFKRSIQTVIDQFPNYIKKYPSEEQVILNEFLSVLHHYDKADYQRAFLSKNIEDYIKQIHQNDSLYRTTPFLWFTDTFLQNSILLLNLASFHGASFYQYLLKPLLGDSATIGCFKLIVNQCALTDLAWEELQNFCTKQKDLLVDEELQNRRLDPMRLDSVYSNLGQKASPQDLVSCTVSNVTTPSCEKCLFSRTRGLEDPPCPYIYYFPYPKGPPVAGAIAIPKKIEKICPKCGEINEKGEERCKKCGAWLIPFS